MLILLIPLNYFFHSKHFSFLLCLCEIINYCLLYLFLYNIYNNIYNNKKYTYKIVNIYNQTKKGSLNIYRDTNKTTLTLITCTKDDKTNQTVYILELIGVETY